VVTYYHEGPSKPAVFLQLSTILFAEFRFTRLVFAVACVERELPGVGTAHRHRVPAKVVLSTLEELIAQLHHPLKDVACRAK